MENPPNKNTSCSTTTDATSTVGRAGILHLSALAIAPAVNKDDNDNDSKNSLCQSILHSALHDRQRRSERGVTKTDLQRARRYGLAEYQQDRGGGRIKYTLGGQVFVYEPQSNTAVTCWKLPHHETCASAHTNPILLSKHSLSQQEYWQHENQKCILQKRIDLWTSHTVIVVDFSGSMKCDDVPGARCRSDAVFLTIARDFVQAQILLQQQQQQQTSSSSSNDTETQQQQQQNQDEAFDVVSIIVMKDQGQHVLIQAEPLDWVLYNKLIDLRENAWSSSSSLLNLKPSGHGYYLPALDMAEELLWMHNQPSHQDANVSNIGFVSKNVHYSTTGASRMSTSAAAGGMGSGCALSLLFFSDGKPSDPHVYKHHNSYNTNNNNVYTNGNHHHHQYRDGSYQAIANRVGKIAARLGRRLTLGCIAMAGSNHGDTNTEFVALQQMVQEAQAHGSMASFHQPRVVHSESLSQIMTTLVTSMTCAKTELTRTYTTTTSRRSSSKSKNRQYHHHHQRLSVRTDIIRERSNHWGCLSGTNAITSAATRRENNANCKDDEYLSQEWRVFRDPLPGQQQQQQHQHQLQYTVNVWTWNSQRNDWVYLMDPRCQHCFALVADENFSTMSKASSSFSANTMSIRQQVPGRPCLGCQACYFCFDCIQRGFHLPHSTTFTRGLTASGTACTSGRATTECQEYVLERRQGSILKRSIPSFSIAVKRTAFGEGAERVAFKFRYLDSAGRFVGPKMVAKESRFVQDQYYHPVQDDDDDDHNNGNSNGHTTMSNTGQRRAYHTQFLQTQAIASRFADLFNKALDDLVKLAPKRFRRQLKLYPRIRFVEPLVFELQEGNNHYYYNSSTTTTAAAGHNISATVATAAPPIINYLLVEPMIEGTYRKFNNNMGAVVDVRAATENDQQKDQEPNNENHQCDIISHAQEMMLMSRNDLHSSSTSNSGSGTSSNSQLKVIQEGSESSCIAEDEDDAHDDNANSNNDGSGTGESRVKSTRNKRDCKDNSEWCIDKDLLRQENGNNSRISRPTGSFSNVHDGDFPQAFSHFTYVKSKKNIMVVDLQGALNVDTSNGKREFVLTDPAIHKRRQDGTGTGLLRKINFGRTNRGHKGMQAFFETHSCNDVCRMLGLPEEEQEKPKTATPASPPSPPLPIVVSSSDSGNMSV